MTLSAVDIESYEKDEKEVYKPVLDATKFVLGVFKQEGKEPITFWNKEELWEYILKVGRNEAKHKRVLTVYGHAHAYDFYGYADMTDPNITYYAERPFIASYTENGREIIKFLDTHAIFKMPLSGLGEFIGMPKLEMPEEFNDKKELETYCKRDVEITLKAVQKIKELLKEDGVGVKRLYTINQIAISRMMYKLRNMPDERVEHIFWWKNRGKCRRTFRSEEIHSAYRGGRVQAWQTGLVQNVKYIDCNSLYPHASIQMKFPDLKTERKHWTPLDKFSKKELLNKIGISRCLVENPADKLGLLMIRTNTQRYTPTENKNIIGTWTHKELREAEKLGYKIKAIQWSVVWEEGENLFKEIIPELYEKKAESEGFERYYYKMMMNAAFGKMAQYKVNQHIIIDSVEMVEEYLKKNYDVIRGLDMEYMYKKQEEETKEEDRKPYYMPILPTLINAYARCYMNQIFRKFRKYQLVYTDTDSVMYTGNNKVPIDNKMGGFKMEGVGDTYIYGNKTYLFGDTIKIAGFNQRNMTKEQFLAGKVSTKQMITVKTQTESRKPGEFVTEERNLKEQLESYKQGQEKLKEPKLYIDHDIDDINYFLEALRET